MLYQRYFHFKIIEGFSNFHFNIITVWWNYAKIQEYCHRIMLSKENSFIPLKPLFMYFSFKVIYRMFLYFRKCLEQIVCRFKTMVAEAFKNYYSIIRVYFFLVCSPFYSVDVSIFNHLFCIHLFLFARHYLNNNILDNVR